MVRAKGEIATHRVELGRFQCGAEGVGVRNTGLFNGADQKVGCVKATIGVLFISSTMPVTDFLVTLSLA